MSDIDSARAAWAAVPAEAKRRVRAVLNTSRLLSSFLADEAAYRAAIAVLEAAGTERKQAPPGIGIPADALIDCMRCGNRHAAYIQSCAATSKTAVGCGPEEVPPSGAGTDGREAGR